MIPTTAPARIFIDGQPLPFVRAKYYRPGRVVPLRLIVIHCMEHPEKPNAAESVADWWADKHAPRWPSPVTSAHVCVDGNSAIQCVSALDTAFAAPPCNPSGFHVELAGYARQTAAEWGDEYSIAMLMLAAKVCAQVVLDHAIPIAFVPRAQLAADPHARGFTTHKEVSLAYRKSTHLDPGPHFPMDDFLCMVRGAFPFGGLED